MMRTKQKNVMIGILSILLIVVISFTTCEFLGTFAAEADKTYPSNIDNGKYDQFTDTDKHNDINIVAYPDFYSKGISLSAEDKVVRMTVRQDNAVALFVPRELFQTVGVTAYIGREYGFITDTFAVEGSGALHTIVMLFDIIINDNSAITKDHLKIRIKSVFQGEFAYVTPQTQSLLCVRQNAFATYDSTHQGSIEIDSDGEYIVPVPPVNVETVTAVSHCRFLGINKYYLGNFQSLVSLYNEHHLNAFDEGYQVSQDQGAYFTQTDFAYSGHFYDPKGASLTEIGNVAASAFSVGLDIIRLFKLLPKKPLIGVAFGMVDFIKSCISLVDSMEESRMMQPTEKGLTYTPDYTTAKEQILNKGYLTKDALVRVISDENQNFVLATGDYIEADYQISSSNPDWKTRYVTALVMDAITYTENGAESFTFSNVGYSDEFEFNAIGERTDAALGEDVDLYLLPGGRQALYLDIEHTGWYAFTSDIEGKYYTRIEDRTNALNVQEAASAYDANTNSYRAYLQAGRTYVWEIGYLSNVGGRQTCRYNFDPQKIAVGDTEVAFQNQKSEYIRLQFEDYYFYRLRCTESGAVLHLYDENLQEIESGSTLRVENGGGNSVFLAVSVPAAVTKNITVHCDRERDVHFETYTAEKIGPHTVVNNAAYVLPQPSERNGYTFDGWWDNEFFTGNAVNNTTLFSGNRATVNLYAKWTPEQYDIVYHENGGDPIADETYTVEDFVRLNANVRRIGYLFKGWYDNAELKGAPVTQIAQGSTGHRAYYAKWVKEQFTVSFNVNKNATDGQSADLFLGNAEYIKRDFSVRYGSAFTLPVAKTKGFQFAGWYFGNVQITDAAGNGIAHYTYEKDIELLAKWHRESYKIKLVKDDAHFYWLIDGGISVKEESIDYIADLCPNCMVNVLRRDPNSNAFEVLYREGYIYQCLTTVPDDPSTQACMHEHDQTLEDGSEYTVYAYYEPELYYFNFVNQNTVVQKTYRFNEAIVYPIVEIENGYQFCGWVISNANGEVIDHLDAGEYDRWMLVPDLTENQEGNGSVVFTSDMQLITFTITYDLKGGSFQPGKVGKKSYTVEDETFALEVPQLAGYRFMGWYADAAMIGAPVEKILKGTTGYKTFYAKWVKEYTVKVSYNYTEKTYRVIAGETIEFPNRKTVDPNNNKQYYDGYWEVTEYATVIKRFNLDTNGKWIFDLNNNATVQLSWVGKSYRINYHYMFNGAPWDDFYTYGTSLTLKNPVQGTGDYSIFRGYFTDVGFTKPIKVITAGQHGTIDIYAKWDYFVFNRKRPGEYKITDKSCWDSSQPYDRFVIGLEDPNTMEFTAFRSIVFRFKIDLWEKDDGYQMIYLYDQNKTELWFVELELVPEKVSSGKCTYEATIAIDIGAWRSLEWRTYEFRYGASGWWADDWYNDNFEVQVFLSTDAPHPLNKNNHAIWNGTSWEFSS